MQTRSEATRNKILSTSLTLFSQYGYDATGVAEICEAAGVSKGAFYHHFPSKQAVFLDLLNHWLAVLQPQVEQIMKDSEDVASGLVRLTGLIRQVFQDGSNRLPMFLEFWTQSSRDPVIWKTTIAPYRHFEELFAGIIRRGIQQGSLNPVDPDQAARLIMAFYTGLILQGLLDPAATAWEDAAEAGMQMIMDGLKRRGL